MTSKFSKRVCALSAVALAATSLALRAQHADASTQSFTGSVSASGNAWVSFPFTTTSTQNVTTTLSWPASTGANLNMFILDSAATAVARATSTTANPESVTTSLPAGTYRIGVKSVTGSTSFTATLTLSAAATSSPILTPFRTPSEVPGAKPTWSQAVATARTTDMILATRWQYRGYVAAMKAANPHLTIYVYSNAAAVAPAELPLYPSSYLAHDSAGNRVVSTYGNYIADISNSGWVQSRINDCKRALSLSGYDGCFYDMLGSGLLYPGYLKSLPINPSTGVAWTHSEWIARTSQMIQLFRQALPGVPIIGNGVDSGSHYFANPGGSKPLAQAVRTIVAECYVRLPAEAPNVLLGFSRWKADLDMVTDAEANGDSILAESKVEVSATQAQIDRWHKLSLATFLLSTNGSSKYLFVTLDPTTHYSDDPWTHAPIGAASGGYYVDPTGAYVRDFATGKVIVNPTTRSITLPLGKTYTTLDGLQVTTLTLAPSTGEVLS
jgi:hypothetical protein